MKRAAEVIKGFFAKDLMWKIFSLLIALALWFVVMNTLNPAETKTFTAGLAFTNEQVLEDKNIIITNKAELENTKVSIKVKGTRPALDELSRDANRQQIAAYIDLSQLNALDFEETPQTLMLSVTPELPDNIFLYSYEIVSCLPNNAEVDIDSLMSETMKLHIDVQGELKDGYNMSDPVCDTDTVRITGPRSMFGSVSSVKASVDITDKTDNISVTAAPAVYDTDNIPMELFTVEPETVDISFSIRKQWQLPVDAPETTGELNENLVLEGISYEPKTVEVEGSIEDINKIQSIKVPPIDLSAIENTQIISYDIRPSLNGTKLQLKDDSVTKINVTVTVSSKASRDVTIKQSDFEVKGLGADLNADIDDVNITVYGAQEVIDSLTVAQLKPVIDLSGRKEGLFNLDIGLTLPENVEMRVTPGATVFISNREAETQPQTEPVEVHESEPVTEAHTEAPAAAETDADSPAEEDSTAAQEY